MAPNNRQSRRLREALQKFDPQIRKAFVAAIQKVAVAIDRKALTEALEAHNVPLAIELITGETPHYFELAEAIRAAYVAGGGLVVSDLSRGLAGRFSFDGRHIRAEEWVRRRGADLIEGITQETVDMARKVITQGLEDGASHKAIARQITGRQVGGRRVGGFLGLNSDQADSVIRARSILSDPDQIRDFFVKDRTTGRMNPRFKLSDRRFDAKIKAAIKEGRALRPTELDAAMEAHRSKVLGYRGRVIARNEAHTALAAGRDEGYQQLLTDPEVETVTVRWQHNLSQMARDDHMAMDGTVIDLGETFDFGDVQMKHPHDPAGAAKHSVGCRCTAFYRVKMRRT